MANGQPKPAFYVAVLLVVLGLVGVALWRYGAIGPGGQAGRISNEELKQIKTPDQLIKLVDSNRERGVDYSPWERAKRNGEIKRVVLPSLEELSKIHVGGLSKNR